VFVRLSAYAIAARWKCRYSRPGGHGTSIFASVARLAST
jgi:hypothetical protein